MTEAAKRLLESFEALSDPDRQVVTVEILRRTAAAEYRLPDDENLVFAADQVFLELDRRESQE